MDATEAEINGAAQQSRKIIVLDSNIWLPELGLRSTLGSAARLYIRRINARLVLPEVVKLEVEQNFADQLKDYVSKIKKNHRQLLALFGTLKEIVLPTDAEIDAKVSQVFGDVGVDIEEVPFSIDSARSSFLKTILKIPPSKASQQFKDGVLWSDCVALLDQGDVLLVTADKAFYQDSDYKKGLATELLDELNSKPNTLKIFESLTSLIPAIKTDVPVDEIALEKIVAAASSLGQQLIEAGYVMADAEKIHSELYATENPDNLYVKFDISFAAKDATEASRPDASLVVQGDCGMDVLTGELSNLRIGVEEFVRRDGLPNAKTVYASANLYLGHRDVTHLVRQRLDEPKG